jgi:hypothetical protein
MHRHSKDPRTITSLSLFPESVHFNSALTALDSFLPLFPALIHLSLLGHAISQNPRYMKLTLPTLQSLTIGDIHLDSPVDFLGMFTLPSLHTLRLGKLGDTRLCFITLLAFIHRSGCEVHHLSMELHETNLQLVPITSLRDYHNSASRTDRLYSSDDCARLLEATPELQTLELLGPEAERFFSQCFLPAAFPTKTVGLVPQLRSMKVGTRHVDLDASRQGFEL